mmetsp:Transcript_34129/g.80315  ORF Transcript_34129/g.80315 Transcript_34129/m.80315 type:complete len:201 (+) Transcript_34129:1169-1771(+)
MMVRLHSSLHRGLILFVLRYRGNGREYFGKGFLLGIIDGSCRRGRGHRLKRFIRVVVVRWCYARRTGSHAAAPPVPSPPVSKGSLEMPSPPGGSIQSQWLDRGVRIAVGNNGLTAGTGRRRRCDQSRCGDFQRRCFLWNIVRGRVVESRWRRGSFQLICRRRRRRRVRRITQFCQHRRRQELHALLHLLSLQGLPGRNVR